MHTVDYDHSYSNYSNSRKQQQISTGILNSTNNHYASTSTTPPSLSTLASGASIQPAPPRHHPTTARGGARPSMRRRGSIESICSVMTETSTNAQRQRLTNAVLQCEETDLPADQVDDIVDMLLTLKKKERSLCLFNPDFLKSKVQQAKTALETFDDGNDDDDEHTAAAAPEPTQHSSTTTTTTKEDNVNEGGTGKRQPPPSAEDMDAFLASLEGMVMHEKKQKLGDWLFPLVKATGIKHAPKITIRLLDTVPLHELAHLMHAEASLRLKIDQVMAGESQSTVA